MKKINFKNKLSKKQKVVIGVTSVLIITGGFYGYTQVSQEIKRQELENSVIDLYKISGREKIFMNGKLVPLKSEKLSVNPEQGELSQIKVDNNAYVEEGTSLFTCKNSDQIKEIESLKSQVSIKSKEKENAIDEESKSIIEEEIKSLNEQIHNLNKTAYSTVYAPFSGKIYFNESDDESYVMTLETAELYVQGQVNERDSYKISLDQGVEVKALATNEKYNGKIIKIGDRPFESAGLNQGYSSDSGMTKYEVKMSLDSQEGLKNGLNVQIVALSKNTSIKLPNVSVIEEGNTHYVYKVKNKIATKTEVKVIEKKEDYYLVENGLNENDEIVKDVTRVPIKDGDRIYTGLDL